MTGLLPALVRLLTLFPILIVGLLNAGLVRAEGLQFKRAQQSSGVLQVELDCQFTSEVYDALEASVPLSFEWLIDSDGKVVSYPMSLHYAPLFERFDLERFDRRTPFRLRTELIDAFSVLMLPVPTPVKRVRIQIVLAKLPAPLRLPALFSSAWDLDTGWQNVEQLDPGFAGNAK